MNRTAKKTQADGPPKVVVGPRSQLSTSRSDSTSNAIKTLVNSYQDNTPARLKLVDAFCTFLMISGVLQFVYCFAITNFPFNSFIAGFAATVGQFVLAASLRIQCNKSNSEEFPSISPERAFGDFIFGSVVLHFFVVNFLG
ncbi:hypothetical protein CBS101457_000631 [Exobasidium rhododendri]|nr:hypothetical protein CBS101457_000631 [Exobasidium rhododendri]